MQDYAQEEVFWRDILSEKVTENSTVTLHNFIVSEWVPLQPGLFHTEHARINRYYAFQTGRVVADNPNTPQPLRSYLQTHIGYPGDLSNAIQNEALTIFDPGGKTSMVQGGVGCIRLKPLAAREEFSWLMSACSSSIVHAGIPIKIRDVDHKRIYDDIRTRGGVRCTLSGYLRFIPDIEQYSMTYAPRIPQICLEVTSVNPTPLSGQDPCIPSVSAVVSFISRNELWKGLYASFVTFDAGLQGALEEFAEWLEKIYIQASYNGRVVSDFDQQMKRFSGASFSLEKLLTATTTIREAKETYNEIGLSDSEQNMLERKRELATIIVQGNYYQVTNAGAVGDGASAGTVNLKR